MKTESQKYADVLEANLSTLRQSHLEMLQRHHELSMAVAKAHADLAAAEITLNQLTEEKNTLVNQIDDKMLTIVKLEKAVQELRE